MVEKAVELSSGDRFTSLFAEVEPGLRRALVAYGPDIGRDAAADALAWAWEHLDRVTAMANPAGYLWRVGQTSARTAARRRRPVPWRLGGDDADEPVFEPGLVAALATLSPRQRAAVVLVHGYGYGVTEAAGALGCRPPTLRNHLDRGLARLRHHLGTDDTGATDA